jgi:6,7-dimethyl-8-ribityllumazine synthase
LLLLPKFKYYGDLMEHKIKEIGGEFYAPQKSIAIVAARFNEFMVERLIAGAQDTLLRHGVKAQQIELIRVPGAYEIPLACQRAAQTNRFAGVIALGAVIRGETAHFDYVAGGCANGLMQAQLKTEVPMTLGVITTEDKDQAIARAGSTAGNKGAEAAMALLEMISVLGKIND